MTQMKPMVQELKITPEAPLEGGMYRIEKSGTYTITGTSVRHGVEIAEGAGQVRVLLDNVRIDRSAADAPAMIVRSGGVTVELIGGSLLRSGGKAAGLMNGMNPVVIEGEGSLAAQGGRDGGAGIGGGVYEISEDERVNMCAGGNIEIRSGRVTAIGGKRSAGIGGFAANGAHIHIFGGHVTAVGGEWGAGVGGGRGAHGEDIIAAGGSLNAFGGEKAAGVGGGYEGHGKGIELHGGFVHAAGGDLGAGIGGGCAGVGMDIRLTGAHVTAIGRSGGAGVGGGCYGAALHVKVNGGSVTALSDGYDGAGIGGGRGDGNHREGGWMLEVDPGVEREVKQGDAAGITVHGGFVIAQGGTGGAGMGSGSHGRAVRLDMTGGFADLQGGRGAAGLGGGEMGGVAGVYISGGCLVAQGGGVPGVCGGWMAGASHMALSGGAVFARVSDAAEIEAGAAVTDLMYAADPDE